MEKQITLKSKEIITLNCSVSVEGFYINAQVNNKSVGMCQFQIFQVFAQKMNERKKAIYAKMHKIPLNECPEHNEIQIDIIDNEKVTQLFPTEQKTNNSEPEYTISDNTLTFKSGGKYNYSHTICELLRIEVTDENYSKKGLGYQMLKFMEEIAEIFDAEQITGQFIPNGNLFYASMEFYKRNGFKFTQQTSSLIKIEKDLNKTKTNQV